MACRSVRRLERVPQWRGARASSSLSLSRNEQTQSRLALLQRHPVQVNVLSNGVRVVTQKRTDVPTASVGLFRKGGSEAETRATNGISGVFQRVQQRGTKSLPGAKLSAKVASLSGRVHSVNERQYNATLFSAPSQSITEGISVLADMAINPELSKPNVDAECASSLATLEASAYDVEQVAVHYLHDVAFQGTTLNMNPMGTTEGLQSITPDSLHEFGKKSVVGDNLYLAVVGDVDHNKVMEAAEKHFSAVPSGPGVNFLPIRYTSSMVLAHDDFMAHVHTATGVEAPAYGNADMLAMEAARHIVGSYDRSFGHDARHSLNTPAFDAHNSDTNIHCYQMKSIGRYYSNIGLWGVYFVTSHQSQEIFCSYITREMHRIKNRCRDSDVARAKCNMKVELGLKTESPAGQVELMGQQLVNLNRVVPLHELDQRIDALNAPYIRTCMEQYFYDADPVMSCIGQADTELTYEVLKKLHHLSEVHMNEISD